MIKNTGALAGVKVLDLTRVLAGPYSGMILADMGAEVVKLEVPGRGDDSRGFTPGRCCIAGPIKRERQRKLSVPEMTSGYIVIAG